VLAVAVAGEVDLFGDPEVVRESRERRPQRTVPHEHQMKRRPARRQQRDRAQQGPVILDLDKASDTANDKSISRNSELRAKCGLARRTRRLKGLVIDEVGNLQNSLSRNTVDVTKHSGDSATVAQYAVGQAVGNAIHKFHRSVFGGVSPPPACNHKRDASDAAPGYCESVRVQVVAVEYIDSLGAQETKQSRAFR
jgi:hypothetical protein